MPDEQVGSVSAEEAMELYRAYHAVATGRKPKRPLMSIPVDFKRDADVRLSAFIWQAGKHMADLEAAAGEFLVDLPEPGTPIAVLLRANRLLREENRKLRERLEDA